MLIYKGRKGEGIAGIPARDLTSGEVKKFGKEKLIQSGLYEKPKVKPKKEGEK